jgi:glycosyltransferase involved in cell wall biosynthesis
MIVQITLIKNELFLLKEMIPIWQKYADAFIFMDDGSTDGTYEYLIENKYKFNILNVLRTEQIKDKL